MQRITYCFCLGLFLLLVACSKQEEVLIPDNTAPPDETVDDIVIESYINRAYISLLGRKPDDTEFATGTTTLRANNLSQQNREDFLAAVMALGEFEQHLFDVGRGLFLNSADTSDLNDQITLYNLLLVSPQYQPLWPQIQEEKDKVQAVLDIPSDLRSGTIDIVEMHRRFCYNSVYDEINMGTQNFVISMFQNFLFRYPTDAELAASELMVDGFNSTVFLETGRTKEDFMAIFLGTNDYYEGQVRDIYTRFLFREPDTQEEEAHAVTYKNTGDYEALLTAVLSTDEYVGL